jgi:glucokinase
VTDAPARPTLGVDLGGTNLRIGVVDAGGRLLEEERALCPATGWRAVVDDIAALSWKLRRDHDVVALGVGVAALVDRDGATRYAPNIPGMVDAPLRAALAEAVAMPVVVDNDANAAAWGEAVHGAARGVEDALVITLGTGIGGGIIAGGRVYRGAHGFAAEVGHWQFERGGARCACGESGHWEACGSGHALGRLGREAAEVGRAPALLARVGGDPTRITGADVTGSAETGDADSLAIVESWATDVALGFAGLVNILDPELIVVSGGLVDLGERLLDPLRRAFAGRIEGAAHRPAVPIVPAQLGELAGVVGAAALARGAGDEGRPMKVSR